MKNLALALLLLGSTSAFAGDCKSEESFPLVTKSELKELVTKKAVFVVDVNSAESFKKHHVPGAIHFAATKDLSAALPADKSTLIVAYCGGPQCGAWKKAAEKACDMGYTNIKHFKGGIKGWVASK